MAAANQPKGSVSTGSIKPVTRKAVRCQREVAWLVTQAAGKLVATTDDVNAPTPSFVLAAALSFAREQEQAARDRGAVIDYDAVMGPDLASFCAAAGLPTKISDVTSAVTRMQITQARILAFQLRILPLFLRAGTISGSGCCVLCSSIRSLRICFSSASGSPQCSRCAGQPFSGCPAVTFRQNMCDQVA